MAIPETMKALVLEASGRAVVKDHPVPPVGDEDVLIKTIAISLNPTDWKHIDNEGAGVPGTVVGCDVSGTIVKVGAKVTTRKVGEHVAAFVHGAAFQDEGAFAEYIKTPADLVWPVPADTLSHEDASALGVALWTAVQAFYHPTRLAMVEPPETAPGDEWVFVYGGSSAVGMCAIQLATLSGYKVITTASPHNFALVKQFGASEVFDYKDPNVVTKIKEATGDTITKALDTISVEASQRITVETIAPSGGKVITLHKPIPEATTRPEVEVELTLLYTVLGRAFNFGPETHFPVSVEDKVHMAEFLKKLPDLVQDGLIQPLPIKLWEGGLEAIPDGLQYMRDGKVSAQKIVYRL